MQRLCDDRADLVPYLSRVIDSLERHGGWYHAELAQVVPVDVIEGLNDWVKSHLGSAIAEISPEV